MTLREEVVKNSTAQDIKMPKLVSTRWGSLENREQIIKFIESVLNPEIKNRKKLAWDMFDAIYQEGYENGGVEEAMGASL